MTDVGLFASVRLSVYLYDRLPLCLPLSEYIRSSKCNTYWFPLSLLQWYYWAVGRSDGLSFVTVRILIVNRNFQKNKNRKYIRINVNDFNESGAIWNFWSLFRNEVRWLISIDFYRFPSIFFSFQNRKGMMK